MNVKRTSKKIPTLIDAAELRRRAEVVRSRTTLSTIIGAEVKLRRQGAEQVGLCPFHHDTSVGSFAVNDGKGIYKCFACQAGGDVIDYVSERKGLSFVQALKLLEADAGIDFRDAKARAAFDRAAEKRERADAEAREKQRLNAWFLWKHAAQLRDTPAQAYLEGRGIDFARLGALPGAIRYRLSWNGELKREIPTMVTAMVGLDGLHVATHRTFLEYRAGRWVKAPLDRPKMILGSFAGAHIPLVKGAIPRVSLNKAPAGSSVRVSEGIEDGLTVAMADPRRRVIAAATLGNMGGIGLPDAIEAVELICQRDGELRALRAAQARQFGDEATAEKHEDAAQKIEAAFARSIGKLQSAGKQVSCLWPSPGFKDFNDQLLGKRMGEE